MKINLVWRDINGLWPFTFVYGVEALKSQYGYSTALDDDFFLWLDFFFEGMLLMMMTYCKRSSGYSAPRRPWYSFLFYLTTTNIMQSLFVFIGPASISSFFPSRSNRVSGPSLGNIQARLQKNRNQSAQLGPWSDHFIVSKYLCLMFSEIIFYILYPKNANMNVLETLFSIWSLVQSTNSRFRNSLSHVAPNACLYDIL